jgi:hypothetical protein
VLENLGEQTHELQLLVGQAFDVQVRFERDGVLDEKLRSDVCEGMESSDASNQSRPVRLLQVHDGVHQSGCDLLARFYQRLRNFFLPFRVVVLGFLWLEHLKANGKLSFVIFLMCGGRLPFSAVHENLSLARKVPHR